MLLSSRKIASQLASPAESLLPVMEGSVLRLLCSSGAVQSTAKLPAVRGKPSCSALTFCYRPENQLCHVPLHPSRLSLCPSQFYHRPKELIAKDLVRGSQSLVSYRDRTRGGCSTIVCTSEEVSSTSLCRFTPLDESGRDHTEAPSTRKLSSRRYHIQRSSGLETPGPGRHSEEDRAKQSFKKAGNVQLAYALQTLREEVSWTGFFFLCIFFCVVSMQHALIWVRSEYTSSETHNRLWSQLRKVASESTRSIWQELVR